MGMYNSLEPYGTLFEELLLDIACCYTNSEPHLDLAKARLRMKAEGISFLTKSLPRLGKAFDKALLGLTPFLHTGFEKSTEYAVPKFLGWLLKGVFSVDGYVREFPDISAIKHVRQILYFAYKLELPYDERSVKNVLESFIAVDNEIKNLRIDATDAVIEVARTYVTRTLSGCCPWDIIPKHGPGSVSTGERGGEKTHFSRVYADLDSRYPFTEYFHASLSHTADHVNRLEQLEELSIGTAKVVLVPKDSRGPRLISCEPLEKQWIQGGQQRKLYNHLERCRFTAGHVNFTDQTVNRRLALESSKTQEFVTLDMKDASDRVSLVLVEQLFQGTEWYQALVASRSAQTRLPDGSVVVLGKFAPMGSAVCFPVEALCFYALAIGVLVVYRQIPWRVAAASVWVYGDDIICRSEDYAALLNHFPRYGLAFNPGKCCTSGFFRESCGCDAYKGVDVTPIRLRKVWNHRKPNDATQLVSYVELHNSMYQAGYRRSCTYIRKMVEALYGPIPDVEYMRSRAEGYQAFYHTAGRAIGWFRPDVNSIASNLSRRIKMRFNAHLHRDEVKGYAVQAVHRDYTEDGWERLLRYFSGGIDSELPSGTYAVSRQSRLCRNKWGASNTGGLLSVLML